MVVKRKDFSAKYRQYKKITQEQKDYLLLRWINPEKVEHAIRWANNQIVVKIVGYLNNADIGIVWVQKRNIDLSEVKREWDKRFDLDKWSSWQWVFVHTIDAQKDYVFIVEWMFDFLSILQYETNVIWLFNATSKESLDVAKEIVKTKGIKKVYWITDSDEAWDNLWNELERNFEDIGLFRLSSDDEEFKDVNDYVCAYWDATIPLLIDICEWLLQENIDKKIEKLQKKIDEKIEEDSKVSNIYSWWKPYHRPCDAIDVAFRKVLPKTMMYLVWAPWCWKTTFTMNMIRRNLKEHKTCFLTYEMDMADVLENYYINFIQDWKDKLENTQLTRDDIEFLESRKKEFLSQNNFYYSDWWWRTLEECVQEIRDFHKLWCTVFYIDHLTKVTHKGNELEDYKEVTKVLYDLKQELSIRIFMLHHTDKKSSDTGSKMTYRGSWHIYTLTDSMVFLKRPWIYLKDSWESMSEKDKAKLELELKKMRKIWDRVSEKCCVYFYDWDYYSYKDRMQLF